MQLSAASDSNTRLDDERQHGLAERVWQSRMAHEGRGHGAANGEEQVRTA
jgi:hypothetical protein